MSVPYSKYWAAGLAVIPEKRGYPQIPSINNKWGKIYQEGWKPSDEDLLEWELGDLNCALVCGEPSGVIAIDVDDATKGERERIIELFGDTPCKKFGSKGITLFYAHNGEKNHNWIKDKKLKVELLSTGRKTTIPPSIHSKTKKPYKWIGKDLLSSERLPKLPEDYEKRGNSVFNIVKKPEPVYPKIAYDREPTYEEAVKALGYCDPSCSNDEWIRIGMSLRKLLGDAAFTDFDNWSSAGFNYNKKDVRTRWRSFNSHSINPGTLFYFANKHGGYQPPRQTERVTITTTDPSQYSKRRLAEKAQKLEESNKVPDLVTNAPRLIRSVTEYLYKTAIYPQPMLSLGAAITTVGFLMGRNFVCQGSGIKANLYTVCIAGSQEGKQEIVTRCRTIMKEFDLMKNYQTAWTSGSAIENVMEQTDGEVFYITDEMGILMGQLVGKYTNSNQQEAVSTILRLYTENYYKGKSFSKSADRKEVIIENPFVSICGFTQREPFFEAMSSIQADTGVLNRMCLFKAPDVRPPYNLAFDYKDRNRLPDNLKTELQTLRDNVLQYKVNGKYVSQPKEVPFTEEAKKMMLDITLKTSEKFSELQAEGDNIHLLFGRTPEVVQKVALIGSCGDIITEEVLQWALAVVEYTVGLMVTHSKDIVDTEFDRKKNKVIEFIKKRGGSVAKGELTAKCRVFDSRREREDVLMDLIEAGRLEIGEENTEGRSKLVYILNDKK